MACEKVVSEAVVLGCVRKEQAWNLITDFSRYSAIMDNIDKVEIIDRSDDTGTSKWQVSIDGAPLYWIEKDFFNHAGYQVHFKSIEGDLDSINGQWRITDARDSGIRIVFEVEYDLGLPVLEEVLGSVLRDKMKSNMEKMVAAIGREIAAQAKEDRSYQRLPVNMIHTARQKGEAYEIVVLNLSAGGMMVRLPAGALGTGPLQLAVAMLDIAAVFPCGPAGSYRLVFKTALEETVLSALRESLVTSGKPLPAHTQGVQEALIIPALPRVVSAV